MPIAPPQEYHDNHPSQLQVLPALRELLGNDPWAADYALETLTTLLHELRYVTLPPETHEVEAALEALRLDSGEVTA